MVSSALRSAVCWLAVLVLAACAGSPASTRQAGATAPRTSGTLIGSTQGEGVRVALRLINGDGSTPVVAATFTPEQAGFHLYSVDLPEGGIEGVGRPTRLQVGGTLTAISAAVADQHVVWLHVAGIDSALPVYPDGAVTLRMPVRMVPGMGSARAARAWVSYAACSSTACLPPVTRRPIDLRLPDTA